MRSARAFTIIDVAAIAAVGIVGASVVQVGLAPADMRKPTTSLLKLKQLGMATAQYQADNNNYTPITMVYHRGTAPRSPYTSALGWCGWSYGGKNNHNYWYNQSGGAFDVEAADRPLNAYAHPGIVFSAPAFPGRMSASDPARTTAQADAFKDPFDTWTFERSWPTITTSISTYNDVGTSYAWNSIWYEQIVRAYPSLTFENKFHEATRRLAQGDGVQPSRFAWVSDPSLPVVANTSGAAAQIPNWYGAKNYSTMLFLDGRAGYLQTFPGRKLKTFINPDYSLVFENLPNPGSG